MADSSPVSDADLRRICHLVSHDLRNPLAAIVTNLEFARRMLEQIEVDPDLTEAVRDSVTSCDVLRRIVANFDLLAKGTKVSVTMRDTHVEDVVREVARRCRSRAEQASLQIVIAATGTNRVLSDRVLLALALENLVDNSIQHAPPGSEVALTVVEHDDRLELTVEDEGAAVEAALRKEAVGVASHTTQGRRDGTRYGRGLALLAARLAVEAVGGTIDLGEADGKSRMALIIPVMP